MTTATNLNKMLKLIKKDETLWSKIDTQTMKDASKGFDSTTLISLRKKYQKVQDDMKAVITLLVGCVDESVWNDMIIDNGLCLESWNYNETFNESL